MEEQKQKKPFFKKWWFWLIASFFIIGSVGSLFQDDSNKIKETSAPVKENKTKEIKKDSDKKDTVEKSNKSVDKVLLYKDKVLPLKNDIIAEYDKHWNDLWKETWTGIGNKTITTEQGIQKFDELRNEKYSPLMHKLKDLKAPNEFSKNEQEKINIFKEKMTLAIDVRISASTEAILMLKGTMPMDIESIKSTISRGDKYMIEATVAITELEQLVGYTKK